MQQEPLGCNLARLDELLHRGRRCTTGPGERSYTAHPPLGSDDNALFGLRWAGTKDWAAYFGGAVARPIAVLLVASTPLNDFVAVVAGRGLRPPFLCIDFTASQRTEVHVGINHRRRGFDTTGERTIALRTHEWACSRLVRPTGEAYPCERRWIDRGWHFTLVIPAYTLTLGTPYPCRRAPRTTPIVIFAIKKAGFRQFCAPWSDVNLIGAPPPRTGVPRATPPWQRLSFTRTKPTIATIFRERGREVVAEGAATLFAKAVGAALCTPISGLVTFLITVRDMVLALLGLRSYNGDKFIGVQTLARLHQSALHLDAPATHTCLGGCVASNLSIGSKAARNGTVLRVEVSGALHRIQATTWRMLALPRTHRKRRAHWTVDLVAPRRRERSLAPLALTRPYQGHFPSAPCTKISFLSA